MAEKNLEQMKEAVAEIREKMEYFGWLRRMVFILCDFQIEK